MYDDPQTLLRQIGLGEDSSLELKTVYFRGAHKIDEPHADGISDELAAFANSAGGVLVLGVDDKTRQVDGIPRDRLDAVEQWLGNICRQRIDPPLYYQTRHLELPDSAGDSQPVVKVDVPRSLWVHKSANGYFHRAGSSRRELSPDHLARLFQQRSQVRIIRFDEQTVPEATFADLEPALYRRFLERPFEEVDAFPVDSPQAALRRLHLLKTDDDDVFRPTVSGVLLCTERPDQRLPSAYVQAVCYSGSIQDSAYQLDAEDIHGPLDLQIRRALAFVLKNQRVAAVKDPAREERPQFSKRALFEAIVNAVVHRDYSIPTARIRLFLFSDRLEIRSPGTIPNSMTLESMRELSLPRNEVIANLMARFYTVDDATLVRRTVMDKRGDGVRVILAESERLSGKRPDYVLIGDMEVKLTLYAAAFRTEY